MNLIQELQWRGMLADKMPRTEEQLAKEMTTGYVGFDPTADSLHIGHLVPILLLVHLQKAGHRPVALVGGATGMVGDPSGKSNERNLLDEATLQKNVDGVKAQLERFLNFNADTPNAALLVNNYDWFKGMGFIEFLRDVGKHLTVNYMMAKDSVKKRIEGETGISYTEFAYQLMQGYDFYWLYKNLNCKLQLGGSDQWGNMTTGTELIRRKAGGEAFVITCPLITKADGTKFGKTESGTIWLDASKTTPYQFYQFWFNTSDADAAAYIKKFTFLSAATIEEIITKHRENEANRHLQRSLAEAVTILVHGEAALQQAIETTQKLFTNQNAPAESLSIDDLEQMEGIVKKSLPTSVLANEQYDVVSLLADTGIFPSRGEARKMVQGGGVSINRKKVDAATHIITTAHLLHGKYLLVQKGKKNYFLVSFS
ncbi:MAG TPA: tyrosine--tRNA ligase [Chitinophagaceae bacterium]|nr:tyrosine--tRNA ligase [Chitinophagaceae bacterium]